MSNRDMLSFRMAYEQSTMISTWCLLLVIICLFFVEEISGGSENTYVLIKMGANFGELVKNGDYYRLLTSVFLHAGYLHIIFNGYVLFALGGFFNKILGETKFSCIFFISGITGSLASNFLGKSHVSVGASGAIWGLFGASLVLALFKTSYLPEAVRLSLRRITAINLLINLGVSFLPMVDFWAHIGGGVGGFLVALLIIFDPNDLSLRKIKNRVLAFLAIFLWAGYGAAIIYSLEHNKPWQVSFDFVWQEKKLEDVPFSLQLPEGLKLIEHKKISDKVYSYSFGDVSFDQIAIEISFFKEKSGNLENWLRSQHDIFMADKAMEKDMKKSLRLIENKFGLTMSYERKIGAGLKMVTYLITRNNYIIRLSLIVPIKLDNKRLENLQEKLLGGLHSIRSGP